METLVREMAMAPSDTSTIQSVVPRAQRPCIRLLAPMRKFDPEFATMVGASAYGYVKQAKDKYRDTPAVQLLDITRCPVYVENLAINTVLLSTTFHALLGDSIFMPPAKPRYRAQRMEIYSPELYDAWPPLLFTDDSFTQTLALQLMEQRFDQIVVIGGIEQLKTILNMAGERTVYLQPLWLKDTKYAKGATVPTGNLKFSSNLMAKQWSDDALYSVHRSPVTA